LKRTAEFSAVPSRNRRPVVLVLDDDWDVCDAIESTLDDAGFATVCLPNGADGLEHLERQPAPAAIILDLMMPVMDGWTFVNRLRAIPRLKDIPILVITASGPHWGYPVSHALHKPVGRNELIAAVSNLVYRDHSAKARW
jgi:two-component system response regulator VicR